jgi:Uncharacterized protein conserved in bacteria (DUF2252)
VQIRDLDQTVIGNPAHDLVRLGLSLASAARGSDPPGVTTARIFEEVVAGYQAALSTNFEVDKEKSHRPKALLVQSTRRRWRHLAEERLDTVKPTIPLGKRFWALTPDHRGMGYRSPRGKVLPHFMPESKALRSSWGTSISAGKNKDSMDRNDENLLDCPMLGAYTTVPALAASESAKMTGQDQNATAPARHRAQSAKMQNYQQNPTSPAGGTANIGGAAEK